MGKFVDIIKNKQINVDKMKKRSSFYFSHHAKIVAVLVSVRVFSFLRLFFLSGGYFLAGRSMTFLPVRFYLINLKLNIK
jgi:hypothetical protein